MSIADELRQQIIDGKLPPGAPIPTLAEIQERYKVAEATAHAATKVLANEGLTETRPGAPTRVRDRPHVIELVRSWYGDSPAGSPWHADMAREGRVVAKNARTDHTAATPAIAERLQIAVDAPVMRTVYVFEAYGKSAYLCTSWEPAELTRDSPAMLPETGPLGDKGVRERMETLGFKITHAVESPVSRTLSVAEADRLGQRSGIAIVVIERTYYAAGRPVETADFVVAPPFRPRYEIPIRDC